jgi:acetyl-CoA C-acetyltransferase
MLADQVIRAGDASLMVAGGMESMSRAPFLVSGVREGWKFGDQQVIDSMQRDGLWCAFEDMAMGGEADFIAERYNVSRPDQDAFALDSHRRAVAAQEAGHFAAEIVPITVAGRKGPTIVSRDEGPRADSSLEVLAKLKPAFGAAGTVTAGNASQISDGAAALIVGDERAASAGSPMARIVASATSGVPPKEIFIAPVTAMEKALAKAKLKVNDIDLFELNEAFASQCLACTRPLKIHPAKPPISGGAIALGHPIGASGARVLVTLLYNMKRLSLKRGMAALCLGGGNAVALIVERI